MQKIIHRDKFEIKNRGHVYTVNLKDNNIGDEDGVIDRDKVWEFFPKNVPVEMDGKIWTIIGMESFAVFRIRDVGLLVKEVTTN
jgi:hypothetical protein